MRKFILILFALPLFSQAPIDTGMSQLNAGFGISAIGLPVYVGYDYAVAKNLTIGGQIYYARYSSSTYSSNIFNLSVNSNYHFNRLLKIPSQLDLYAGASLGYFYLSSEFLNYSSGLGARIQIGGRYYFNKKFGVNIEFGGATINSGIQLGITYTL